MITQSKPKHVEDISWERKSPCKDCPFLRTSPFHQGICAGIISYSRSLEDHKFCHTCHQTDNRPECDGPRNWKKGKSQHCAGAIMMVLKSKESLEYQVPLLMAHERGFIDIEDWLKKAEADKRVFTWYEFIQWNYEQMFLIENPQPDKEKAE